MSAGEEPAARDSANGEWVSLPAGQLSAATLPCMEAAADENARLETAILFPTATLSKLLQPVPSPERDVQGILLSAGRASGQDGRRAGVECRSCCARTRCAVSPDPATAAATTGPAAKPSLSLERSVSRLIVVWSRTAETELSASAQPPSPSPALWSI